MTHKRDWVYHKIDGRTAEIKLTVKYDKDMHHKDEDFYFESWDDAYKFYLDHGACYAEDGFKNYYLFQKKWWGQWFVADCYKAKERGA